MLIIATLTSLILNTRAIGEILLKEHQNLAMHPFEVIV